MESGESILFLKIQASSEIAWFEMLRANHRTLRRLPLRTFRLHEIDTSLSSFLLFWTIIAIKRYGMKCNTFVHVSCVATFPNNTPSWHFYELYSQPFPQKQVNMRNTDSLCSLFYVTSELPLMSRWPQDGGILTYFDEPWKIEDLTKSKIFAANYSKKRSCIILTNIFGNYVIVQSHLDNSCKPVHKAPL